MLGGGGGLWGGLGEGWGRGGGGAGGLGSEPLNRQTRKRYVKLSRSHLTLQLFPAEFPEIKITVVPFSFPTLPLYPGFFVKMAEMGTRRRMKELSVSSKKTTLEIVRKVFEVMGSW